MNDGTYLYTNDAFFTGWWRSSATWDPTVYGEPAVQISNGVVTNVNSDATSMGINTGYLFDGTVFTAPVAEVATLAEVVTTAATDAATDIFAVGGLVLPIAAVLLAVTVGWRFARKFLKG